MNKKVIKGDSWEDIGLYGVKQGRGDHKVKGCPECGRLGKNNKEPDVSVNDQIGEGHCFQCGAVYIVNRDNGYKPEGLRRFEEKKSYRLPSMPNPTKLGKDSFEYMKSRGISSDAIELAGLVEMRDMIIFPYEENGVLINYKGRGIHEKKFVQAAEARPIMYLYDQCKGKPNIVICEGEIDALSYITAFIDHDMIDEWGATSVNAGAPNENDREDTKKLDCFMNSIDLFEEAKNVYISVDNDANGKRLEDYILKRVEKSKVLFVENAPQKDGNQVLTECGIFELLGRLERAKRWSPPGIYRAGDIRDKIIDAYRNGFAIGDTTHFPSIDKRWTIRPGDVVVFTGYNNDGKSIVMNQIQLLRSMYDGDEHAIFSPENMPIEKFFLNLSHQYIGKHFKEGPSERMSEEELNNAISFLQEHFHVVNPPSDYKWTTLIDSFEYLCRTRRIKTILIDPYNQIEHYRKPSQTIDEYVSTFMSELKRVAVEHNVTVILITHQNKPDKVLSDGNYPKPNKYNIKNGGSFSDKADVVLALWRPFSQSDPKDPQVYFITMKVKDAGMHGEWGESILFFDRVSARYNDTELGNKSPFDVRISDLSTGKIEWIQKSITFQNPDRNLEPSEEEDYVPF